MITPPDKLIRYTTFKALVEKLNNSDFHDEVATAVLFRFGDQHDSVSRTELPRMQKKVTAAIDEVIAGIKTTMEKELRAHVIELIKTQLQSSRTQEDLTELLNDEFDMAAEESSEYLELSCLVNRVLREHWEKL